VILTPLYPTSSEKSRRDILDIIITVLYTQAGENSCCRTSSSDLRVISVPLTRTPGGRLAENKPFSLCLSRSALVYMIPDSDVCSRNRSASNAQTEP
jgi:hypothetical protein